MSQSLQSAVGMVPPVLPVFLLASRASVADLHYSFTRHAFTAAYSYPYPKAHRGGYEQG